MNPDSAQEAGCSVLKTDYETSKEIDMTEEGRKWSCLRRVRERSATQIECLGSIGVMESGPSAH
jgi:hypothetical protein